ncbi:MAG TPA: lamin tail domain-containing protein [Candidatus Eisenbacteria bacterium]|nr:lamin tail domain-containing protein [Candidatus Eisenbacteria bacterium]
MSLASIVGRALASLVILTLLFLNAPAATCDILLNEILAAPARDWNGDGVVSARDDEWIEIWNQGTSVVDLSSYFFTDADSTPRYAFSGLLGPNEHRVVFGGQAVDWQRANARSVAGLSLNNAGDTARLWRVVGPDTVLADAYAYKSHEGGNDRSTGREPDGGAWALFDGLDPYTGALEPNATGCFPSPGDANTCHPAAAEAVTWGRVKGIYR